MIFLTTAGIVIPIGKRLSVSPVLGFLLIGLVIGPYGLGRLAHGSGWLHYVVINDLPGIRTFAELGVIFLLFMIGLELSLERLWAMRRLVFGLGGAQILVTGLVIGGFAWSFGNTPAASVVLGGCLALSSTAIVMQLLTEQGRFGTPVGRGSFAILLAQDIAVVPILFIVGAFGVSGETSLIGPLLLALGKALLAIVLILGIGRIIVRPVFRFVGSTEGPEMFMAATLLVVVATAAITHAAGLSAALGSFLAGLLFAETEFKHEIEVNIEPFKGLLLGLFFMSVGMGIDLLTIFGKPFWMAASIFGLYAIKGSILFCLARLFGYSRGQATEMGLLLGEAGEFGFVVVAVALSHQLLPEDTAQFMLIVVAATMLLTPIVSRFAHTIGNRLDNFEPTRLAPTDTTVSEQSGHVVIAGYGRTGKLLARLLDRQKIAHLAVDINASRTTRARRAGLPVYYGDASKTNLLVNLNLKTAAALVITSDDPEHADEVLCAARQLCPDIPVIVRARDNEHARLLMEHGATQAVLEIFESGLEMGRMALEHAGLPAEAARELSEMFRAEVEAETL